MNDPCCEMMLANLVGGETAIVYVPKLREYGVSVLDGGSSLIVINHCPWCGKALPASLRDEWSKNIEARGFEAGDDQMPADLSSDAWWRGRSG